MHKAFYRIFAMTITIILILCLCAPCFAIGLAWQAIDTWSIGWQLYCESHGMMTYYSTNGVFHSGNHSMDQSTGQQLWTKLYNEYKDYDPNQVVIDQWASTYSSMFGTYAAPIETASGILNYLAVELEPTLVEWYDNFANWLLQVKMGVPSESGTYHSSGSFANNKISYLSGEPDAGTLLNIPVSSSSGSDIVASGLALTRSSSGYYYWSTNVSDVFAFYYHPAGGYGDIVYISTNPNMVGYTAYQNGNGASVNSNIQTYRNDYYYLDKQFYTTYEWLVSNTGIPSFDTLPAGLEYFVGNYQESSGSSDMVLSPKEKVREDGGDIYIPQPSDPNYVPDAINVPTNLEYIPSNSLTQNLSDIQTKALENASVLELDNSLLPNPVISPFVPFDLPSFNFNFSGIWHYVVSWIGSIRSGSSFIFSVWNNIPFAMTIPIYATAVVCIVVGVFRKVF